jgi:hypothetical protein
VDAAVSSSRLFKIVPKLIELLAIGKKEIQ